MSSGDTGSGVPQSLLEGVQRKADMDLLFRLLTGILIYLTALVSLGTATLWPAEHPHLFWTAFSVVGISMAVRGLVFIFRERLYSRGRSWVLVPTLVSTALGAGSMGLSHVAILHIYGFTSWTYVMMMMWMLGIIAGSTISFTPNFSLLLVQTSLLIGPTLLFDSLVRPKFWLSHGIAILAFFGFHVFQGHRLHRLYFTLLIDRANETRRNRELEAAKMAAERAERGLRYQATHDMLTGILNRGQILSILDKEFARAIRSRTILGAVMFDLDYFKRVNDQFGHLDGDEVLRRVANRVESSVRQYDAVGRYGGEEFLIVLPGCNLEQCVASAERIRKEIETDPVQLSNSQLRVTASFGVTVISLDTDMSVRQMIARADRALYAAKRNGRNRVEVRLADAKAALVEAV